MRAGRDDLLRNALRGVNPEGRVFAWEGLEKLGKVRDNDRAVMRKLPELPPEPKRCHCCMPLEQSSSNNFVER
jgi:hypothetical protein